VEISADIAGEITQIFVREGDHVKRDQTLVTLDSRQYSASRDQASAAMFAARASVRLAEAQLELAQRTYERQRKLLERHLTSQEAVDSAQTQLRVAQANADSAGESVHQTEAGVSQSSDVLRKTTIRSPMDGVVTKLNKETGEIAVGSAFTRDVIMVVSDPHRMVATVDVDEADIVEVKLGDRAKVTIDALPDKKFDGQVIEIAGSAKETSQTLAASTQEETVSFQVKVLLEGDTSVIRPGMTATADIVTETRQNVLQTPIQCVTMRDPEVLKKLLAKPEGRKTGAGEEDTLEGDLAKMKELLFLIVNNRATPLWIKTGISSDTHIEVQGEGLREGAEVVCGDFKTLNRTLKPHDLLERSEKPLSVSPTP
jgi:HlyD family secretion protein